MSAPSSWADSCRTSPSSKRFWRRRNYRELAISVKYCIRDGIVLVFGWITTNFHLNDIKIITSVLILVVTAISWNYLSRWRSYSSESNCAGFGVRCTRKAGETGSLLWKDSEGRKWRFFYFSVQRGRWKRDRLYRKPQGIAERDHLICRSWTRKRCRDVLHNQQILRGNPESICILGCDWTKWHQ